MSKKWNKFYTSRRKKVDLAEFGLPEFWVELYPITGYPRSIMKEFEASSKEEEKKEEENKEEGTEAITTNLMYKYCIVAWNLTDPDIEEEVQLPLPKDNPGVIDRLPVDIVFWLSKQIQVVNDEALPPELRTKTTSTS
jgi:hypothetical protein